MKCRKVLSHSKEKRCESNADFKVTALGDGTVIYACAMHFIEMCEHLSKEGLPVILKSN